MKHQKVKNVVWHHATVNRERREKLANHRAVVMWFTGLSGAGKSSLAHAVEEELYQKGCRTYVFDGDNVRQGLCSDLGFSDADRSENLRRIGEMVKLFLDAGVISLTAFISPFVKDRERIKSLIGEADFLEIYCDCPIEICESRDVKGLYQKARRGKIPQFTGISSPYEPPENADLKINTGMESLESCVKKVINLMEERGILPGSR